MVSNPNAAAQKTNETSQIRKHTKLQLENFSRIAVKKTFFAFIEFLQFRNHRFSVSEVEMNSIVRVSKWNGKLVGF